MYWKLELNAINFLFKLIENQLVSLTLKVREFITAWPPYAQNILSKLQYYYWSKLLNIVCLSTATFQYGPQMNQTEWFHLISYRTAKCYSLKIWHSNVIKRKLAYVFMYSYPIHVCILTLNTRILPNLSMRRWVYFSVPRHRWQHYTIVQVWF